MAEIAPGIIWAGKTSDGLYVSQGGNFRRLAPGGLALAGPEINALLMARDGSCWMAGAQGLLHFTDPASGDDDAELFTDLHCTAMAEDKDEGVWVGTREGEIWRRMKDKWAGETNDWQKHPITAIGQARDGATWVGSDGGGVDRFFGDQRFHLDRQAGLLSDLVRAVYLDDQGVAWVGTAGGGLSRWRAGQLVTFTTREGLPDNTVSQILEDHQGRLWLGSSRGIACVGKSEFEELAAGKIPAVYPLVYGRTEGMLSEECTGGYSPAGTASKSGLLWFPTLKGLVVVDPRRANRGCHTAHRDAGGGARGWGAGRGVSGERACRATLRIPPGNHRVEFRYTGVNFDSPERVRFRYRLEGLDTDWLEAGTRRSALYNYVPPGQYDFRITACNGDGAWSETGVMLSMVVAPHFWQVWWVRCLAALGILLSVAGAVRVVEKRKSQRRLKRLEQEKALERERTRIAQDLHDEMGAKLCRISYLSEHARRSPDLSSEIKRQIVSISDSTREVLSSLDEIVWAINPQNDMLEHLVSYIGHYAREYFSGDRDRVRSRHAGAIAESVSAFVSTAASFVAGGA